MRVLSSVYMCVLVGALCNVGLAQIPIYHPEIEDRAGEDPTVVPEGFCWQEAPSYSCPTRPLVVCAAPVLGIAQQNPIIIANICKGAQRQDTGASGDQVETPDGNDPRPVAYRSDGSVWLVPCVVNARCIAGGIDANGNATSCVPDLTDITGGGGFYSGNVNYDLPCIFNPEPVIPVPEGTIF